MAEATRGAFVAGATGYTGRHVVAALRDAGIETHAHVRPDSTQLERWRRQFGALGAHVDTTPWQTEALTERLAAMKPRWVFALLGTTQARARALAKKGGDPARASYEAVDYGLTAMLLEATRASCPHARFVYLSALGVKPNPKGGSSYAGVRARMEAELAASGVPHAIARPGFVSGDDREESRPLERMAARGTDALVGLAGALGARRLHDQLHSLSGEELARALVSLAMDPAAENAVEGPRALRARL